MTSGKPFGEEFTELRQEFNFMFRRALQNFRHCEEQMAMRWWIVLRGKEKIPHLHAESVGKSLNTLKRRILLTPLVIPSSTCLNPPTR
jgi:hypothetical protein